MNAKFIIQLRSFRETIVEFDAILEKTLRTDMRIEKIQIENFRLLKNFSIDIRDELTLVVGKNNTGKSSLLALIDKFLNHFGNPRTFTIDDFNLDFRKELIGLIGGTTPLAPDFTENGIRLKLFISYDEKDKLDKLSPFIMDLEPSNHHVVIGLYYSINRTQIVNAQNDYKAFLAEEAKKTQATPNYVKRSIADFAKRSFGNYFEWKKRSIYFDSKEQKLDEDEYLDLVKENLKLEPLINFQYISAKREVSNKEQNKTLSLQTSEIYNQSEKSALQEKAINDFKDTLESTDKVLSDHYATIFEGVVEKVKQFGGISINDTKITISSTLSDKDLLNGNTTVKYNHSGIDLPEYNNGLGYMNLISLIFQIEILIEKFKRIKGQDISLINLLYIEEPEAHTHPQMQYVFIKNIKTLLAEGVSRSDGQKGKLTTIISTHSAHIVSDCNFDDVRYLKPSSATSVKSNNLSDLKYVYSKDPKAYQFLKQYLTISRAEIFFADKAILIEGDTERILIPTLMKKIDYDEKSKHEAAGTEDELLPLSSQHISIIEVGAHSQIFDPFIRFLGLKTLIITDLDTNDGKEKCRPLAAEAKEYSNYAIKHYFEDPSLEALLKKTITTKTIEYTADKWITDAKGSLCITYQTKENDFVGRSFEDAFINVNRAWVTANKAEFKGLKNRANFDVDANDPYDLAGSCVSKKTHFALDILYHSNETYSNWEIPNYLKEGLLWLKK